MNAEIVLTGTELLLGETIDTNSTMISLMLRDIGLDVHYKTVVGDNESRITEVLEHALTRVNFVIVSGGLGPTVDDVTRQAAAAATNRPLVYVPMLEEQIAARFKSFGRQMGENNKRQAWIPQGAIPIENPVGTAPCFIVETTHGIIICLPGVPHELEHQMKHAILPYLQGKLGQRSLIKAKILRTCGIGESNIDREIDDLMHLFNPTVGLAAHIGQVDIRIAAKASSIVEADSLIAPIERDIRARLGNFIFGIDKETLPEVVGNLLNRRQLKLAIIDTVTAGITGAMLTQAGFKDIISTEQLFATYQDALTATADEANSTGETIARHLAWYGQQDGVLGISIVGPLKTPVAEQTMLVGVADDRHCKVRQYQLRYDEKTIRQWLAVQALTQLWQWLQ